MGDDRRGKAEADAGVPPMECVTGPGRVEVVHDAEFRADAMHARSMETETLLAEPIVVDMPQLGGGGDAGVKLEQGSRMLRDASAEEIYRELLLRVGEDPERDGLKKTPERMEKSLAFLTRGYAQNLSEVLGGALFDVDYDEMVIVRDIEFYSQCEHHMLPFFGKAHVAYIPNRKVIGLSKLPRVVDMFARRLQVQERLTRQIAEAVIEAIQPQGVGVILEAQHLCMMMRGVEKQSSLTTTSAMLGVFRTQQQTRNEFLSLVRRPGATV